MDVNVRELVNGSFQFYLWTNKENVSIPAALSPDDSQLSGDEVYIDHKLISECYIGMNKFSLDKQR